MVFHTRAGGVVVESLVDRHSPGSRSHSAGICRCRNIRLAMPDSGHCRDYLSRMWFDNCHDPDCHRPMGNRSRNACVCTDFFWGSGVDDSRHSATATVSAKAFHDGGGVGMQNRNNRYHHPGNDFLLVAKKFGVLRDTDSNRLSLISMLFRVSHEIK